MSRGVNLDLLNPAGDPEPASLKANGFAAVRLVSKPDPNGPGVHPHIEERLLQYKALGIFALVVITNESEGRIPANHHGTLQCGNEPDGAPPSSMVMSQDEYVAMFNLYSGTYPDIRWIAAGLCSGNPQWWADVMPRLESCHGVAVHPYGKTLAEAKTLLATYRAPNGAMPLWVTEWNRSAAEIPGYDWWLRQNTENSFWFCWSDAMVSPYGVYDAQGLAKPELAQFKPIAASPPPIAPTPPPPVQPMPVLHQWASDNFWIGRPHGPPIALVIHTEAGSEGGTIATFTNNSSQVSAHFGVGLDGRDDQFVKLGDSAWANGIFETGNAWQANGLPNINPNYLTVSCETEDGYIAGVRSPQPVTDAQYATVMANCRLAMRTYPSIKYLLGHRDISPHSRPNCPGPRWIESGRFAQLAAALGLKTLS